jgi:antitoxin component YwqK of YwqJK toxin-antitoxin module
LLFLCAFTMLVWVGCNGKPKPVPEVEMSGLEKRDDGLYLKESGEKFNGWLVEFYENESEDSQEARQLKSRSRISSGLLDGVSTGWYRSGQQQVEEHFVRGVSHGNRIKWYADGQKKSEEEIVDGALNGVSRKWHENGTISEEMTLVNGQPDGLARSWYDDGSLMAEVELKLGEVVRQDFKKKPSEKAEDVTQK